MLRLGGIRSTPAGSPCVSLGDGCRIYGEEAITEEWETTLTINKALICQWPR
jgi:hypothetical protein